MRGMSFTRSQRTKQHVVMAGAFLVVFVCAVLLGLATRQLVHAIDPDEWQGLSTKSTAQTTDPPEVESQPAATREGVAVKKQAAPSYACTSLRAQPLNTKGNAYSFRATVATANGAALQKLVYSFGDGTASVTRTSTRVTAPHTYTKAGTFAVKVRSYFTLPGERTVSTQEALCSASISIPSSAIASTKATTPTVQRSQAPLETPPAVSQENAPVRQQTPPTQTSVVAAAPKKTQPTTTTQPKKNEQLPRTGPGSVFGWFVAVSLMTSGVHMLYRRRKGLSLRYQ